LKQPAPRKRRSTIRHSTDADVQAIYAWLVEQDRRKIPGSFLCNWGLTEKCHGDGELLVYIDGESSVPVAYQWGGLIQPGILEVRHDMRGRGIGSKLVDRRLAEAYKRDHCILKIQCKPFTSIPFWKKMGFTLLVSDDDNNYAYRILEKKHQLPPEGDPIGVIIRVYPEEKNWENNVLPFSVYEPTAVATADGIVNLGERVAFTNALHRNGRDAIVEIEIADVVRYCDKARYEEADKIGVHRCENGFYIDRILPTGRSQNGDA